MTRIVSDTEQILAQHSGPVPVLPWLFDIHGSGFMFYGYSLRHRDLGIDRYVRTHWFTLAYVPIFPLGAYLLSDDVDESGRPKKRKTMIVHRRVYARGVAKIWGLEGLLWLIGSAYLVLLGIFAVMVAVVMIGDTLGWWNASD
jgi:hypothetical protein